MSEGDRATARVDGRRIGIELVQPGQRYGREGLVHLDGVDIADGHPGAVKHPPRGWDRAGEHQHRVVPADRRRDHAGPRAQTELLRAFLAH